jgi:hypothetical protein
MAAFFNLHLPPVGMSLGAAAVRIAAASGELGLFLGMLLGVAVLLVVLAGFLF